MLNYSLVFFLKFLLKYLNKLKKKKNTQLFLKTNKRTPVVAVVYLLFLCITLLRSSLSHPLVFTRFFFGKSHAHISDIVWQRFLFVVFVCYKSGFLFVSVLVLVTPTP